MRINKYLAMCGICSRRKAEELVLQGKVTINTRVISDLATDVNPRTDIVSIEGKQVELQQEKLYIMINKPTGFIVTKSDEFGRKTVYNLLPKEWNHLFPIGRLDRDSEGLLLMTNDGEFAQHLIHPKYELSKIYRVEVAGRVKKEDLEVLREGIELDGKVTLPARIFIKNHTDTKTILRMTIYEGRNRQIRMMFDKLGYSVLNLRRLQIGNIKLGDLPVGMFRLLRPSEIMGAMPHYPQFRNKE